MTSAQFISADPSLSVWLSASAGTGKTKVLVDRVLRIVLRGDAPSSILCLTYTKAAAMEMQIRIQKELAKWSAQDDLELQKSLHALLGTQPSPIEIQRARTLLATLLESVEGVKIQTIHAFCQSLLSRFPHEAGLVAAPQVMDDRTRMELLNEAHRRLLLAASDSGSDEALRHAVHHLASRMADSTVQSLFQEMTRQHLLLRNLTDGVFDESALLALIYDGLGVAQTDTPSSIVHAFKHSTAALEDGLHDTIAALHAMGGKTIDALAKSVNDWLESSGDASAFKTLSKSFLTAQGEPKTIRAVCTESFAKKHPDHTDVLLRFQHAIYATYDQFAALDVAQFTQSVLRVAASILEFYRDLKSSRGLHDYDDLIADTLKLLSTSGMCEWVMVKLGHSIRHLLVDEAQDTSPEQWQLVRLLTQELMVPDATLDAPRSLFVVGDPKQSIFKFQGADPHAFAAMQHYFKSWFEQSGQAFAELSLAQSFRSSKAVLGLVDAVCALPHVAAAIGQERVVHELYRNCAGNVSLWPVVQVQKPELLKPWDVTAPNYQPYDANEALASQIADNVAGWLHEGRMLESENRPIVPSDIMILLRTRAPLASKINRHLLLRGVAVAGADRIALTDHLAVQDILAIAQWCLLQGDDLTLATVLKGPWFEWNEDALCELAHNRGDDSLWQRLRASDHAVCAKLERFYEQSRALKPFEWIHFLLFDEGGLHALTAHFGMETHDICEELLEQALLFESQHTPVLQQFVAWMQTQHFQTKRELVDGANGVRTMTIHAAKGLEAPIVIIPMINKGAPHADALLLDWHNGKTVCYVMPSGADVPLKIEALKANQKHLSEQEEYRLLYVALTRARDELHIAGALARDEWSKNSWYPLLESLIDNNTAFPDSLVSGLDSIAS